MPLSQGIPNIIDSTQAYVLRNSGQHCLDSGLLAVPPEYSHGLFQRNTGKILSKRQRNGIRLLRFELLQVGAAGAAGIGFRFDDTLMKVGHLTADGATYTDLSAAVKARTVSTIQTVGAVQDGFVVGFPEKFGWLSTQVSTAETDAGGGTVPDHAVQYSQSGTTWATTTAGSSYKDDFTKSNTVWIAETKNFVWAPPADWLPNDGTLCGGELKGLYLVRFTSAHREANDVAAVITGLEIGILEKVSQIAQHGIYENEQSSFHSRIADGVVAFFGTADAGNRVYAEWETV